MKKTLCALACFVGMGLATVSHAAVLTFDMPALIGIDNNTGVATYHEGGFVLSAQAPTFLTLDGVGTGGTGGLFFLANNPVTLMAAGGGLFSLLGLDFALNDPNETGVLNIQGWLDDNSMLNEMLSLATLQSFNFQGWGNLRQVSFSATADVVLDNINAVPEPASAALTLAALSGLVLVRRRSAAKSWRAK
jgi:hypothetical protein